MSEVSILRLVEQIPDEASAYEYLEGLRWGGQPVCPHCGNAERCYFLTPKNGTSRATRTGAATQRRLWKCGACRKQFSVLTDTIMHGTKIAVRTWVFVIFEMCASKNGVSAREIERKYGLTPRSAWFMTHRIREAMKDDGLGMFSGVVVADETYIGGSAKNRHASTKTKYSHGRNGGLTDKAPVLTLIDAASGQARSRVLPRVDGSNLRKAIAEQADLPNTVLHTDKSASYRLVAREVAAHHAVDHAAGEYVRGTVSTNKAENFFSQLKRSIDGTHHAVSVEHLHRYLAEFDFRYTTRKDTDSARMRLLATRMAGRRLAYRPLTSSAQAERAVS